MEKGGALKQTLKEGLREGLEKAEEAIEHEKNGQIEQAVTSFADSIELLAKVVKEDRNGQFESYKLMDHIKHLLQRAEVLKKSLEVEDKEQNGEEEVKDEHSLWVCEACTYENDEKADATYCNVCETPRKKKTNNSNEDKEEEEQEVGFIEKPLSAEIRKVQTPEAKAVESVVVATDEMFSRHVWNQRRDVKRLYQGDDANSIFSQSKAKGVGTYVSEGHADFTTVDCLLTGLFHVANKDKQQQQFQLLSPKLLHFEKETLTFSPHSGQEDLRSKTAFVLDVYYPYVFGNIRTEHKFNLLESLRSNGMFELQSQGKSGSFFFFTSDMKYLIKTVSSEELSSLNPPNYYHHLKNYRNSLLNRIVSFCSMSRNINENEGRLFEIASFINMLFSSYKTKGLLPMFDDLCHLVFKLFILLFWKTLFLHTSNRWKSTT